MESDNTGGCLMKTKTDSAINPGVFLVLILSSIPLGLHYAYPNTTWFSNPVMMALIIGIFYTNIFPSHIVERFKAGTNYVSGRFLHMAIILYGFQLDLHDVYEVGLSGFLIVTLVMFTTLLLAKLIGKRVFGVDDDLAILTASGTAICGAAAVLAIAPIVKSPPHKNTIAVSIVILLGSLGMLLYPLFYRLDLIHLDASQIGLFVGATLHGVSHVVAAGTAIGEEALRSAVMVKMVRVLWMFPFMIVLSIWVARKETESKALFSRAPWFALGFVLAIFANSFLDIPLFIQKVTHHLESALMVTAIMGLGMQTYVREVRSAGHTCFLLALSLFVWTIVSSYGLTKLFCY